MAPGINLKSVYLSPHHLSSQHPWQPHRRGGHPPLQPQPLPQQPPVPGQQERLRGRAQLSAVHLCARYKQQASGFFPPPLIQHDTHSKLAPFFFPQAANWARPRSSWCSRKLASRCRLAPAPPAATRCAAAVPAGAWRTAWRCPAWTPTSPASWEDRAKVRSPETSVSICS